MEILKAKETDIDDIERIYEHIHDEEENGRAVIGWIRNVYPVRRTAEDALSRNDLFVMKEKNEVVAAAIINQIQVEEYKYARWRVEAEDSEVMVLHCLAVEPSKKNKGYGKNLWHSMKIMPDVADAVHCEWIPMHGIPGQESCTRSLDMRKQGL